MRELRYQRVVRLLRELVAADGLAPGSLLPSEAELSARAEVSRATVRRALEALRDEGVVGSRQGLGWFVAGQPLPQPLDRLGTIEAHLAAAGFEAERRILSFAFTAAPPAAAAALGVDDVLEVRRVNLAGGEPVAVVTVWVPDDLGAGLSRQQVAARPFHDLLPVAVARGRQTITAGGVEVADAGELRLPAGAPVLVAERTTYAADGRAVLHSRAVFHPLRTEFVVDLPARAEAEAGLRVRPGGAVREGGRRRGPRARRP